MAEVTRVPVPNSEIIPEPARPVAFYERLAALPRDERENAALHALLRELRLEGDHLRQAVIDRLRAWAELSQEAGSAVSAAYGTAQERLLPEQQTLLYEAEGEAVLNGLSYREFERLAAFVPWLRAWYLPRPLERPAYPPPLHAAALSLLAAA